MFAKPTAIAESNEIEMSTVKRTRAIPARYFESLPAAVNHELIDSQYRSLYFNILSSLIEQINFRFDDTQLDEILAMSRIIRAEQRETDFDKLVDMG
jgi:hypothetical protein